MAACSLAAICDDIKVYMMMVVEWKAIDRQLYTQKDENYAWQYAAVVFGL